MARHHTLLPGITLAVFMSGASPTTTLRAQGSQSPGSASASPTATPAGQANAAAPHPSQPENSMSAAANQMAAEMQSLKDQGKLTSNRAISSSVRRVIRDNSIQHDIPAPLGAKVIAVHKQPGDLVHAGDKIVTLLVNGKEVPILAKQEGVMQTINVSKGGVIGNSRPRSAKNGRGTGIISLTLRPLSA